MATRLVPCATPRAVYRRMDAGCQSLIDAQIRSLREIGRRPLPSRRRACWTRTAGKQSMESLRRSKPVWSP